MGEHAVSAYSLSVGLMDIGRAENSSVEKTTCSECNGFGGTCRGGTVLLLNDVQRMFHEWNHESLCKCTSSSSCFNNCQNI